MGSRRASTIASLAAKSFSEMPGPASLPLLGSPSTIKFRKKVIEKHHEELLHMYRRYGPVFKEKLPMGGGYLVHVFHPEDARTVFMNDGKRPFILPLQSTTREYRKLRGRNPGLGNINGEEWYRLRSAVQQAMMRPESVHEYLPFVNEVAERLVGHIKENQDENKEVDMRLIAGRWSLEAAGLITFEKRLGALSNNLDWADRLIAINKEVFVLTAKMRFALPIWQYIPTRDWKRLVEIEDIFYFEVDKLADEAIEKLTKDGSSDDNMIKFASKLINKPNLNHNDIKSVLFSLFSDGLSTTAPTLIYNLYLLAKNSQCQDRLRAELRSVNPQGKEWTPEKLNRLSYLRGCIKEAFRLLTITTEISRVPQTDIVLGGYYVPAETPIEIHTGLMARLAGTFPDADVFKPTRWLRDSADREENRPYTLIPFSHGPRMCAGRRFADQDLLVVLATLISTFQVAHEHAPIGQVYETLLMPSGDCRFKFTPAPTETVYDTEQAPTLQCPYSR